MPGSYREAGRADATFTAALAGDRVLGVPLLGAVLHHPVCRQTHRGRSDLAHRCAELHVDVGGAGGGGQLFRTLPAGLSDRRVSGAGTRQPDRHRHRGIETGTARRLCDARDHRHGRQRVGGIPEPLQHRRLCAGGLSVAAAGGARGSGQARPVPAAPALCGPRPRRPVGRAAWRAIRPSLCLRPVGEPAGGRDARHAAGRSDHLPRALHPSAAVSCGAVGGTNASSARRPRQDRQPDRRCPSPRSGRGGDPQLRYRCRREF